MELILRALATVALAAPIAALVRGRFAIRRTSLRTAWWWTAAALAAWCTLWVFTSLGRPLSGERAGLAWYAVAVMMLCPPVAVLGARRPGAAAWTWFVVLPLLVVLSVPALTALLLGGAGGDPSGDAFRLEAPWAIGFALVAVMGAGNYVGTRMTLPALAYVAAVVLLVGPLTAGGAALFPPPSLARCWGTMMLGAAGFLALVAGCTRPPARQPIPDRLWRDFRDLYGVVWARRIMDRTNEALAARRLPARLEWSGIVWTGGPSQPQDEQALSAAREHAAQTLRWLLKRFAAPEWIERRLSDDGERVMG